MPDVLDSFVIELGLDPKKLNQGQQQTLANMKKFQEEALRSAKGIEDQSRRSVESLEFLKGQALGIFAAFTGGKGIVDFVTSLAHADSAVGRVSRSTGVSVGTISKWQGAARMLGGDAATMAASFVKMSDAMEGLKVGVGDAELMANLAAIGKMGGTFINPNDRPEQLYLEIAANLEKIRNQRGPEMAGLLGRRLGLDPALLDMLLKGPAATKQILDQVNALGPATEKSADAAGELERRWNSIFLRTEGTGRQVGIIPDILKASDVLNMTPTEFYHWLRGDSGVREPGSPRTPGFSSGIGGATGAFTSQADKEAFIRAEAARQGQNPDVWMGLAKGEGFNQYKGDFDALGHPTSFGAMQLHYPGVGRNTADGLGTLFTKETGLDARDPATERQQIVWSMQYAKTHGLADWHGWHGARYANLSGGGSTTTTTVAINGPITIQAGPNADGNDIAQKFRDSILKRAALANQSPVGSQ